MSDTSWSFRMDLSVVDKEALYRAACERAQKEGDDPAGLCDEDGPDINACLVMLLDPGSLVGCSIHQSSAEQSSI